MLFCTTPTFHFPPSMRASQSTSPLARWLTFLINILGKLSSDGKVSWLTFWREWQVITVWKTKEHKTLGDSRRGLLLSIRGEMKRRRVSPWDIPSCKQRGIAPPGLAKHTGGRVFTCVNTLPPVCFLISGLLHHRLPKLVSDHCVSLVLFTDPGLLIAQGLAHHGVPQGF